ncbi:GNAT family N-acetyltransferase [Pontimicrobium sp. SW4]|uniref:GNAT family N-acetyltransferase n=1 Tax=Pontimicrobium sp. SW4 TaxID=3153519 RepID=A0AAU7BW36_9FLAO
MISNPFTSQTYGSIWTKHFSNDEEINSFDAVNGVKFVKDKRFPFYVNVGKNQTNGMTYQLDSTASNFKNKTVLIHDVLSYLQEEQNTKNSRIKVKIIPQYKGLYANLSEVKSIDEVMVSCFSSKSRSRFRGRIRQIETNFNISQKVYFGDIDKADYLEKMDVLKSFIVSRFEQRNEHNSVVPLWGFYVDLIYPLILEKKVVFNVINDGEVPIAMSINFVYDDMVAIAIRSFDISHYKYNIGNLEIYKLIEWCIDNNINILDFSKGKADYKDRWSDKLYAFECHVIYDSKSLISILTANSISFLYRTKQYLRDKNINLWYTKVKFKIKKLLGK